MRFCLAVALIFQAFCSFGSNVPDTLYINMDTTHIATYPLHFRSFNHTSSYNVQNAILHQQTGDTIDLVVINNDTLLHTFTIDGLITSGNTINPNDTGRFEINITQEGCYRFYSDVPYGELLGASGILSVGYDNHPRFYWNLFDQQDTLSEEIALGMETTVPIDYTPEVFLINNLIYPATAADTLGHVTASVNDTVIIYMVNSGKMDHVFHFHGYHVTILGTVFNGQTGWEKDTFPIIPADCITVRLVPDKPGTFPVHDHNLITVTTGAYPGGMITILDIAP